MTDTIYSTDAYAAETEATVLEVDPLDRRVLLDRTVFYPGGGGQPYDTGALWVGDDRLEVIKVTADSQGVWHWMGGDLPHRNLGVRAAIDWDRCDGEPLTGS